MAFSEDLTVFFNSDTPGYAQATFASLNGKTVDGLFDRPYGEAGGGFTAGYVPTFICSESDITGLEFNDDATINGIDYQVDNIEPDGTGIVTLMLRRT